MASVRIEMLNKENYDTWKMQMEALLIKNDAWTYVSGESIKPDDTNTDGLATWKKNDRKAMSDIILAISPSELKQVKGCDTSREVWLKLENVYQSKGPARKATLLKQLTLQRMKDGGDIREHLDKFFDAVDKLNEMKVEINPDLLAIMLLYSLPSNFENFRCAIESRDTLPTPEALRVKIVEESDARKNDSTSDGAMYVSFNRKRLNLKRDGDRSGDTSKNSSKGGKPKEFKFKCYKCHEIGHKAAQCKAAARSVQEVSLCAMDCFAAGNVSNFKWCLDSGATSHLCRDIEKFSDVDLSKPETLNLANSACTDITAKGTVKFNAKMSDESKRISLENTLHVPDLRSNLLSVAKMTDKGFKVVFHKQSAEIVGKNGNVELIADRVGDLYYVREYKDSCSAIFENNRLNKFMLWHRRLGHLNQRDVMKMNNDRLANGLNIKEINEELKCEICIEGKLTKAPYTKAREDRTTHILEIIHSDVCGPMRADSHGGSKYFVTFIDDKSRWCEIRFLKSKSEVFKAFKDLITLLENQKGRKVKSIQSDNGKEYCNKEFDEFLVEKGITRRLTVPYNPQQNGIAERKNRTLIEMARCLLIQSNLTQDFWAEAVNAANHIRNRCPSKTLNGKTPFEVWTGKRPNVGYFREFGCKAFVLNKEPVRGKMESKCKEGIFVGYSEVSKGYRVWIPERRKIEVARDIRFLEDIARDIISFEKFAPDEEKSQTTNKNRNDTTQSREDEGENQCVEEIDFELGNPSSDELHEEIEAPNMLAVNPENAQEERYNLRELPRKNYKKLERANLCEIPLKKAMDGPDSNEWFQAMMAEMESIIENDTWVLVDRHKDQKTIGCRMVLRNKCLPDGSIDKRKARLVAQGFSQQPGVDFNQTFAPVARMSSIRLIVALAARYDMHIHQFDVTSAYLNGKLDEEIYMEVPKYFSEMLDGILKRQPPGKIRDKAEMMKRNLKSGDKVCLLKKALYGLRQAGRNWNAVIDKMLMKTGAKPTKADPCVYQINCGQDASFIIVYVDDILVISRDETMISKVKTTISKEFKVKSLGEIENCLGIEFTRNEGTIHLSQRGYILELLKKYDMAECNAVSTPIDVSSKLKRSESIVNDAYPYRELVGALTYLAVTTRPDISFAVSHLGQFNNCYDTPHWVAAKRVLRYLKGSLDIRIGYKRDIEPLVGYVDADWGNCEDDRRSYTGYLFKMSGGPISWDSKKQRTVALSSMEAEYMGITEATKESIYLREFLKEIDMSELADVHLYTDSMSAMKLAENPIYHARSKHIDIRHHFVRDALKNKVINLEHIPTEDMVADVLTKGLSRIKHLKCASGAGLQARIEGEC